MREAMAVTGYLQEAAAKALVGGKAGASVEVQPERDVKDVVVRVATADIEDTRVGSTTQGQTLVQLILRHGASVETVVRTAATPAGYQAFHDPVLNRVRQEATAKKIMV